MEAVESFRFAEEIQSLISPPPALSGSSFSALLGLPSNQAVELLHQTLAPPAGFSPTFPTNSELIERAARFSVFAAWEAPEVSNSSGNSAAKMKAEPADSGDRTTGNKRKEVDKSKVKSSSKKSKSTEDNDGGERLPYVHVRARRGQATDSHSLAERARREKINARMKLLQELVPGCSKGQISGTALVLDKIINHVQSLQRQVEFLSMRLAAVNPSIDFSGLDNILSSECGLSTASNRIGTGTVATEQSTWLDSMINDCKEQQQQQQIWFVDPQQQQIWERDVIVSNTLMDSTYGYDSSNPSSVSLPNQLKAEL